MQNRLMIARAAGNVARMGLRAYRRSGRPAPRSVSRRAGQASRSRTRQFSTFSAAVVPQCVLATRTILFPSQQTTAYGRIGHTIRLVGYKLCMKLENVSNVPLEIHWAFARLKTGVQTEDDQVDFFRQQRNSAFRTEDFPTGNTSWPHQVICNPINPDKFDIITHKRRILDGKGASPPYLQDGRWLWKIDHYFKFNGKQVSFDATNSSIPHRPFKIFVWGITPTDAGYTNAGTDHIRIIHKDLIYFRNGAS